MASWKETSPGHFERPFDSMGKFFLAVARGSLALNREHFSISTFAQFDMKASLEDTESALRHAWKTMRYDHPQLACVACGETRVYKVPDNAALDSWLNETFIVAPASVTKEELLASFRPSALATLHFLPHQSEIIIHSSHWRIDFIGALGLLQNLFNAIAEPRQVHFGDEGRSLSPSRDEAADYCSLDELGLPALVKDIDKAATDLAIQYFSNIPSIGFSARNLDRKPGGTRRSEVILEPGETSAIVCASKKRDLSVTTAMHAALIVALQEIIPAPPSSPSKYTTLALFNIRPLLKAPLNDSAIHPVSVRFVFLPLTLHTSTFSDNALQLKQFYKQRLPPSSDSRIHPGIMVPYTNQMADIAGQSPLIDLPVPSEPLLSSIGIVDGYLKRRYGDIEVKKFWVGVEMTTPQIIFHLWTWQGKMTLSAMYNEVFYDKEFIDGFLKRVIDTLCMELAI